ncbi:MAG: rhodanese-like domain-containing protein [Verrucomicrobia bacterium]|nr:rhodanese-like domain-containing protein [Verrucomicrobiota bacterium]
MEISPVELQKLLLSSAPRAFRLIDVREEDEFAICQIDGAELIPLAQVAEQAPLRLLEKEKPIVVYCHHGMRSAHAAQVLRHLGYKEVYNLTGGIEAWAEALDPLMRRY